MSHKKVTRIDPLQEALPAGGVDSHAHLNGAEFAVDRQEVLKLAAQVGISGIGNIFLSPEAYELGKNEFADYPGVFFLLGIHPSDGQLCTDDCLDRMEKIFLADNRIRALGEIGLDYHYDHCPQELQRKVFAMQLELAKKLAKPIVIHCRDAEYDCLSLLEAGGFKNYPLLWHCFGGAADLAKRIIDNGWHLSIPGSVTFPANRQTAEAVRHVPADRILLETDCPYLSPVPWRGTRNQPAYLVFTARFVAAVRNVPAADLWLQCGRNASSFFDYGFEQE